MDYLSWGDLAGWRFTFGVGTEDTAKDIMEQLAQGVFVLHENGILHRDIKPEVCRLSSSKALYLY